MSSHCRNTRLPIVLAAAGVAAATGEAKAALELRHDRPDTVAGWPRRAGPCRFAGAFLSRANFCNRVVPLGNHTAKRRTRDEASAPSGTQFPDTS